MFGDIKPFSFVVFIILYISVKDPKTIDLGFWLFFYEYIYFEFSEGGINMLFLDELEYHIFRGLNLSREVREGG